MIKEHTKKEQIQSWPIISLQMQMVKRHHAAGNNAQNCKCVAVNVSESRQVQEKWLYGSVYYGLLSSTSVKLHNEGTKTRHRRKMEETETPELKVHFMW